MGTLLSLVPPLELAPLGLYLKRNLSEHIALSIPRSKLKNLRENDTLTKVDTKDILNRPILLRPHSVQKEFFLALHRISNSSKDQVKMQLVNDLLEGKRVPMMKTVTNIEDPTYKQIRRYSANDEISSMSAVEYEATYLTNKSRYTDRLVIGSSKNADVTVKDLSYILHYLEFGAKHHIANHFFMTKRFPTPEWFAVYLTPYNHSFLDDDNGMIDMSHPVIEAMFRRPIYGLSEVNSSLGYADDVVIYSDILDDELRVSSLREAGYMVVLRSNSEVSYISYEWVADPKYGRKQGSFKVLIGIQDMDKIMDLYRIPANSTLPGKEAYDAAGIIKAISHLMIGYTTDTLFDGIPLGNISFLRITGLSALPFERKKNQGTSFLPSSEASARTVFMNKFLNFVLGNQPANMVVIANKGSGKTSNMEKIIRAFRIHSKKTIGTIDSDLLGRYLNYWTRNGGKEPPIKSWDEINKFEMTEPSYHEVWMRKVISEMGDVDYTAFLPNTAQMMLIKSKFDAEILSLYNEMGYDKFLTRVLSLKDRPQLVIIQVHYNQETSFIPASEAYMHLKPNLNITHSVLYRDRDGDRNVQFALQSLYTMLSSPVQSINMALFNKFFLTYIHRGVSCDSYECQGLYMKPEDGENDSGPEHHDMDEDLEADAEANRRIVKAVFHELSKLTN